MLATASSNGVFTLPDGLFHYRLTEDGEKYGIDLCEFDLKYQEWYDGREGKPIHWMTQQFKAWIIENKGPVLTLAQADALMQECNVQSLETKKKQNERLAWTQNLRPSSDSTPDR